MISIDSLTVEFSGTTLFKDISFTIGDKDRIALMGKNGAGKSTLLKIIAGVRSATRGRVTIGEGGKVGYLPQHLTVEDGRTLVEEASRAFEHLFEIERRIASLNEQLTTRTDYESESYMRLIEEVTAISEKFYAVDLTNYQEDVERILLGLGLRALGLYAADLRVLGRMAHAHRAGQTAVAETRPAAVGRADEPPRHRIDRMAGGLSDEQRQGRDGHFP